MTRLRFAVLLAIVFCVGCDHATKGVAKAGLEHAGPKVLIGNVLDLSYTENRDSGFSLLGAVDEPVRRALLTSTQLVAGAVCLLLAISNRRARLSRAALLLLSAGAIGNGLDRLVRGYVVDFVYLHHWPVFNLADVYITIGVVLILVARRWESKPPAFEVRRE